jgi:ribosomal protein S18 acetylase RimI-like enzyme
MEIRYSDGFSAAAFLGLAREVWPRDYDESAVASSLGVTTNIGAWDGDALVGSVRVLTDGHLFATVPELLVDPGYRRRGIGRELMSRAVAVAPRGKLFFGAQPESVGFFKHIGATPGPSGFEFKTSASIQRPSS